MDGGGLLVVGVGGGWGWVGSRCVFVGFVLGFA